MTTDQPVLPRYWSALHRRAAAHYSLYQHGPAPDYAVQEHFRAVVDCHGDLVRLDADADLAHWLWIGSEDYEEAGWQQAEHERAVFEAEQRQARDASRTRDLLRPPPVTVEIVTEPEHPLCVASVVVGPDPRIDAPLYSLRIGHESPVLITHAQLAALMLAGQQLCAECKRPLGSTLQ